MGRLLAYAGVAVLVAAVAQAGLAARLGAHPWWAAQVVWVGGAAGMALGFLLDLGRKGGSQVVTGFVLLGGVAFALSAFGKARFAASYAEDWIAGRLWYGGWIVGVMAVVVLVLLALRRVSRA